MSRLGVDLRDLEALQIADKVLAAPDDERAGVVSGLFHQKLFACNGPSVTLKVFCTAGYSATGDRVEAAQAWAAAVHRKFKTGD